MLIPLVTNYHSLISILNQITLSVVEAWVAVSSEEVPIVEEIAKAAIEVEIEAASEEVIAEATRVAFVEEIAVALEEQK